MSEHGFTSCLVIEVAWQQDRSSHSPPLLSVCRSPGHHQPHLHQSRWGGCHVLWCAEMRYLKPKSSSPLSWSRSDSIFIFRFSFFWLFWGAATFCSDCRFTSVLSFLLSRVQTSRSLQLYDCPVFNEECTLKSKDVLLPHLKLITPTSVGNLRRVSQKTEAPPGVWPEKSKII